MEHLYEKALESAEYIKTHTKKRPECGGTCHVQKNTVIRKLELSRRCSMALRTSNWCFWKNILGNEDGKSNEPYPRPEDVLWEFLKQN